MATVSSGATLSPGAPDGQSLTTQGPGCGGNDLLPLYGTCWLGR